mgnify:CR=1 FL=1
MALSFDIYWQSFLHHLFDMDFVSRYGLYVGIIFIIMYGDKSQDAYLEKSALETAIIHGGTNCDVLPDDDPNFKACDPDDVPDAWINFMKVQYRFYIFRKNLKEF